MVWESQEAYAGANSFQNELLRNSCKLAYAADLTGLVAAERQTAS